MQKLAATKGRIDIGGAILAVALTLLYFVVVLRTAWLTDDAAITFRTVLNCVHGFGATFNIDERVQAYTHPLWFLVLTTLTLVFRNVFYVAFVTCISISVASVALLLWRATIHRFLCILVGCTIIFSKVFVDFSTSGLESPLSNLLLLIACALASSCTEGGRDRLTAFLLVCSGIYLNRPDMLLMVLPLIMYVVLPARRNPKQLVLSITIAAAPIILWTAFALFYYGFPFPNTAYAKLGSGVGLIPRILQGAKYYAHAGRTDPLTLFTIACGVVIGLRGTRISASLSIGIILYLLYILSIGGDFMDGRFFFSPFFISLLIFTREVPPLLVNVGFFVVAAMLGTKTFYPNIRAGNSFSDQTIHPDGIADERAYYFQRYGLINARKETFALPEWKVTNRHVEILCGELGYHALFQGPGAHYIDPCALTDPLLARLPALHNPQWRIGHFDRKLPTNYVESIRRGENLLTDPKTKAYWDSIRTVTRGPLFDRKRFVEIAKLNLGLVEKPDWNLYRYEGVPR